MKKTDIIRYKAGIAALFMAGNLCLTGCTSETGFAFDYDKNNKAVASQLWYINNQCIKKCEVVEIYNELTEKQELYIARRVEPAKDEVYYSDLFRPGGKTFYENNELNNFMKVIKTTPLIDYINALNLNQGRY